MTRKERAAKKAREAEALEEKLKKEAELEAEKEADSKAVNEKIAGVGEGEDLHIEVNGKRNKGDFDVNSDPDYPPTAISSNIIVEEIEMNGKKQKVFRKTYILIDGKTVNITRMQ